MSDLNEVTELNETSESSESESRRDKIIPWIIVALFGLIIAAVLALTLLRPVDQIAAEPTASPTEDTQSVLELVAEELQTCEALVESALLVSAQECRTVGSNQVCYGNDLIEAGLAPGTTDPFVVPGDVVGVEAVQSLFTAPLSLSPAEWGVAVFKLRANMPGTVPGQNVTFLVYGNTTLDNDSGDMQAFYFTSGLGNVTCEKAPLDGLFIDMPDGTGMVVTANGTDITMMGTGLMQATVGEEMTISLLDGSAAVTADGEQVFLGAGQAVSVPLGGESGVEASGVPSEPFDLSTEILEAACELTGLGCDLNSIETLSSEEAQSVIEATLALADETTSTTTTTADGGGGGGGGGGGSGATACEGQQACDPGTSGGGGGKGK